MDFKTRDMLSEINALYGVVRLGRKYNSSNRVLTKTFKISTNKGFFVIYNLNFFSKN